jgi:hypothetical protein
MLQRQLPDPSSVWSRCDRLLIERRSFTKETQNPLRYVAERVALTNEPPHDLIEDLTETQCAAVTDWWDAYALATNLNGYRITILTLEQFTKCCVSAGLVGVGVLLSKTSRRGHKSAKFAVVFCAICMGIGSHLPSLSTWNVESTLGVANAAEKDEVDVTLIVRDATDGTPIKDFVVLAGSTSGLSNPFEKEHKVEVANWQSHTTRKGANGELFWSLARAWERTALRVEANGYIPHTFYGIKKDDGAVELTCQLKKDSGINGSVLAVDGKNPVKDAVVALGMVRRDVVIKGAALSILRLTEPASEPSLRDLWDRPVIVNVDDQGRFTLPTEPDPTAVVVVIHEEGVIHLPFAEWKKSPNVTLQPWGLIHGQVLWGDRPGSEELVTLSADRGDGYGYYGILRQSDEIKMDEKGKFVFQKVLPGRVQLSCPIIVQRKQLGKVSVNMRINSTHVDVKGSHTSAMIGGKGAAITGKLTGLDSYEGVTFRCHPDAPSMRNPEGWSAWISLKNSPEGALFFRDGVQVEQDGTFRIPTVLPGYYQIFFTKADEKSHLATGSFRVESEDHNVPDLFYDIGEFQVRQPKQP